MRFLSAPYFTHGNVRRAVNRQIFSFVCGVAVNATHLYWSENGTIARVAFESGDVIERLVAGDSRTCGMAIGDSHLYWPTGDGNLGRANLDGTEANLRFITGGTELLGVVVDRTHMYWADRGRARIGRANLDGSNVDRDFLDVFPGPRALAVDGDRIYWAAEPGLIARAKLDGSDVEENFISLAGQVTDIAVYGPHIYWSNRGNAQGTIGRANLDGSDANREFIVLDGAGAFGVAVDSRPVILPPGRSSPARFGRLLHNRKRGVAFMQLELPAPGAVKVTSSGLRARILGDSHPAVAVGPPRVWLKLWPRRKGRVAKRIRRQLQRRGKAPVMFKLIYREDGAFPFTTRKRLALKRRVGKIRRPRG